MLALAMVALTGAALACAAPVTGLRVFGLGLIAPGAGFLAPLLADAPMPLGAWLASGLSLAVFGLALILWFGTGNVLAPPLGWLGAALLAAVTVDAPPVDAYNSAVLVLAWLAVPALSLARLPARPQSAGLPPVSCPARPRPQVPEELLPDTLALQRLLLDRALQPIAAFEGFEWRDQFQTAAVRYQVNFISYALSLVQAHQLPAFSGYMVEAQHRLLAKQSDPRMWRYWRLESAWGHLRPAHDPVPRDNIMYSGFVLAQIALAEAVAGRSLAGADGHLDLALPNGRTRYDKADLARILADQYDRAPWGLLACEPGWIYPLCNLLTGVGLRTADADRWAAVAPRMRRGLDAFTTRDGRLVPFRSTLTGLGLPPAGGIVMQAFPCLFLSALYPDLAQLHWGRVRAALDSKPWPRLFWPVDVGNYGFSRASSLAASAAAAVELGDGAAAAAMLAMLDARCPARTIDGVRHRPRASLWAHALELAARCNRPGGLAALAGAGVTGRDGPCLAHADYPDVLVAGAVAEVGALRLVLHLAGGRPHTMRLARLRPERHYRIEGDATGFVKADGRGEADLVIQGQGRTVLLIKPVI
ncbi:hypothetical protein [Sphingomonas jatrophae]|uniref:linalool dehydratase/isomerase domain-containing protein n=1 Tax=Sphingomonas jatrophae TaxID=1166337 RepID=UPI001041C505|nr:hypothetical protein [Sphingomonas jatrophae]